MQFRTKQHLDEWQIAQPPELHGETPSGQDLILIVWVLLDVVDLINGSEEVSQECDVELVTCSNQSLLGQLLQADGTDQKSALLIKLLQESVRLLHKSL